MRTQRSEIAAQVHALQAAMENQGGRPKAASQGNRLAQKAGFARHAQNHYLAQNQKASIRESPFHNLQFAAFAMSVLLPSQRCNSTRTDLQGATATSGPAP